MRTTMYGLFLCLALLACLSNNYLLASFACIKGSSGGLSGLGFPHLHPGVGGSFPSILLYHVGKFNYEFALLVLLARFERVLIFPSECCFTALAVNIGDSMKTRQQNSFLSRSTADINYRIKQIGTTLAALEGLGDEFVVIS
uniref:Pth protein n=1 Tax=Fopius arisanus TaxID=64838 RepID=A0A0C9QWE0_9HYME